MKKVIFKLMGLLYKFVVIFLFIFSFSFQTQLIFAQEEWEEGEGKEIHDEYLFNPDTWANLKAPSTTKKIYLTAEDGGVFVTVWQWYCSVQDQPIDAQNEINKIFSMMPNYTGIINTSMEYRSSSAATKKGQILARELKWLHKRIEDYRNAPLEKSFQNISFQKNGTVQTPYLNVPSGTSNIHVIRNHCYLKKELKTIKAQVLDQMRKIINDKEIQSTKGSVVNEVKDEMAFEFNKGHQLKIVLTREKSNDE